MIRVDANHPHAALPRQTSGARGPIARRADAVAALPAGNAPSVLTDFRVTRLGLGMMSGFWGRMIKGVKQDQLLPRLMPGWEDEGGWVSSFPGEAIALGGAICNAACAPVGVQRRAGIGHGLVAPAFPRF